MSYTPNIEFSGDVTSLGNITTITSNKVSDTMLSNVNNLTFKGRISPLSGSSENLTVSQATSMLNVFVGDTGSGSLKGLVPATISGDGVKYLKGDGTWGIISGSTFGGGTVTGPTQFTNGLTANTISSTNYLNLPTDVSVTGGTYSNGTAIFANTTGGTFNLTGITSTNIPVKSLGVVTYSKIQDFINTTLSSGRISGGELVNNGNGTLNILLGSGMIKTSDNIIGETVFFNWPTTNNITPVNNETSYVYVDYNGGVPSIFITTNFLLITQTTQFVLASIYRQDDVIYTAQTGTEISNLSRKIQRRITEAFGFQRTSGIITSESGVRGLRVSTGIIWAGLNRNVFPTFNTSSGNTFSIFYRDGGAGFTETQNNVQLNNLFYDDGSGIPAIVSNSRYASYFIFASPGGKVVALMGQTNANLSSTQASFIPSNLPKIMSDFSLFIAKVILDKGDLTKFTEIQLPYDTLISQSTANEHNQLANIQGGTVNEYYHITSNDYNNVVNLTTLLNQKANLTGATFTGSLTANTISATTYFNLPITIENTSNLFSTSLNAGSGATFASDSNFFGQNAGYGATGASNSNFFGKNAGYGATGAKFSNFLGRQAGYSATTANNSNFLGDNAGFQATNAESSNFLGYQAGRNAINAYQSNFMGYQAGYSATGAFDSNFFGASAGYEATNASFSNFIGPYAGQNATNAGQSNFLGYQAGYSATSANNSNLFGYNAGSSATNASNSNFFGASAGNEATNAESSNFFGQLAGNQATDAYQSNFFGNNAGNGATSANGSNFIGPYAGQGSTFANNSNFFGNQAGYQASDASFSNFLGRQAGYSATSAGGSNFLGRQAGYSATSAYNSNFLGDNAGFQATNADSSNFFGQLAGSQATNASGSNFFGITAGINATNAFHSNFFGFQVGNGATNAYQSNFFGYQAGNGAIGASYSNFFGQLAGNQATDAYQSNFFGNNAGNGATNAFNSNFIGQEAGFGADNGSSSNYLGYQAGYNASQSYSSNFFGTQAGINTTFANNSNFFGDNAGNNAASANNSNFLGLQAGSQATFASNSNFLGQNAGSGATNARNSNFLGLNSGYQASTANNSNFFGVSAGYKATSANNSTLIGFNVGNANVLSSIGPNNIIIGTNISLSAGTTNSINLGGVLFARNTYSATTGNPSILPQTNGRIGVNVVNPTQTFEVSGTTILYGGLTANTISATTYLNLPSSAGGSDIRVTGGTYSNGTALFTNNTGGTFNVTGFSTGSTSTNTTFTGGTVTGNTVFTNGVTANTVSATTYFNLPTDIRVTGGTYTNGTALFTNNTGGTFNVTGFSTGSTSTNNTFTGGTVTGATQFTNGITANTISATTYFNLPTDIRVTGGTYTNGTAVFSNNTGGTFNVTGFSTGGTSTNNTFTGGTVTGATQFTNGVTANTISTTTISATTYLNLPSSGGGLSFAQIYSITTLNL